MKLVTWNVQWCLGCEGRVDPQRIVDEARAFADFDVLCLQEVGSNFPALKGSRGEDQFAVIASLLPGFTAVPGIAVDTAAPDGARRTLWQPDPEPLSGAAGDAPAISPGRPTRPCAACRACSSKRSSRRRSGRCG